MSCKLCSEFQDSGVTSFFRWKNANVEIRACEQHLTEIFEVLRKAQQAEVSTTVNNQYQEKDNTNNG